jgi:hypothetical protein
MKRIAMVALTTAALLGLAAAPTGDARAERRIQLAFNVEPANARYTQQHVIDVGDVPGHQLRIFEVRHTYPNNPLVINGLKIVESWTRGAPTTGACANVDKGRSHSRGERDAD